MDDAAPPDTAAPGAPAQAVLAAPGEPTTIVPAASAGERATAGAALFESAPVVVLAPDGDVAAQAPAASAAVALGVPLLLTPSADEGSADDEGSPGTTAEGDEATPGTTAEEADGEASSGTTAEDTDGEASSGTTTGDEAAAGGEAARGVEDEVERLEPAAVLAFGDAVAWAEDATGEDGPDVVAAPGAADDLAALDGLDVGDPEEVAEDELLASVTALTPDAPPVLQVAGGTGEDGEASPDGDGGEGELPDVAPADEHLGSVVVLVAGGVEDVAAAATARAAGARVVASPDGDPRAHPDAIAALAGADEPPEQVVAIGDGFDVEPDVLRRRVDVAATGVELPGGGQVLYPGRRMAALYGHPGTPAMGVLGEQGVAESIARAEALAAEYAGLVDEPVIPAFEVIATVASSAPGPDGDYSAESTVADLRPWVDAAGEAGMYVVLDLQPGRTDFLTQAQRYEELLAEPHVGLALDPEWRLGADQVHLAQIGSVGIDEVNRVGDWLAQLTAEHHLPQKLLLLHQFRTAMIDGRERLDMGHDELAVLIHADGFGSAGQKFATWDALHQGAPDGVWWGWKNFYDEDQPMFTPAQTTAIRPAPVFVSYQ